jgi:hypothetical protein
VAIRHVAAGPGHRIRAEAAQLIKANTAQRTGTWFWCVVV